MSRGVRFSESRSASLAAALCLAGTMSAAQLAAPAMPDELGPEDAVASALANQPQLKAVEESVQAAAARSKHARWNRLGQLETFLLYTPEQRPLSVDFPGFPPYVPPSRFEVRQLAEYSLTLKLTQPLFTWGALTSQRQAASREEAASREGLERARQETAYQARQAFFQAATAVAAVAVAERNRGQQAAFLEVARSRERAGAVARLDVLKAELAVAQAESDLGEARNAERLAREALATATMDPRFRSAPLAEVDAAWAAGDLPSEDEAIARARQRRSDLRALERQAEALDLAARAASAAARPALVLQASITQQNDIAAEVFGKDSQLYNLGLAVTWDGFEPLRSREKVAELRATERSLRQSHRGRGEAVALEVRSALSSAREAQDRMRVQERAVQVAEEQARVARLAYGEGLITATEAQDAELALTAARFNVIRARHDAALALAQLRLSLGE